MRSELWSCLEEAYAWLTGSNGQEFIGLSIIALLFMIISLATLEPIETLFSQLYLYLVRIG